MREGVVRVEAVESRVPRAVAILPPISPARRLQNVLPRREGAFWVLAALVPSRLFGPVFTIVLRRFLGPGLSGTFDLAYTPYRFLDGFRNFGTGPALVFQRSVNPEVANTAWTLNMVFAVIVTLIAQLLAHPIAAYYGHPQVEALIRLLSIAYILTSVGSVHQFLLMRDLNFRTRSVPAVGQVLGGGALAVLFAMWGFGTGALVVRELASALVGSLLLWAVYPFRPRIEFVPDVAWSLFRYGAWIGAGLSILFVSQNPDIIVGGRIIRSSSDIGFYSTSWKLAFIVAGIFSIVASGMIFPTLTRLHPDLAALQRVLLASIRQVGLITLPAAALLAVLAPVLIVPLLGTTWAPYRSSFAVLSLLAVYAGNRTMLSLFFEGYKSVGKPWIVPVYNAVKLIIMGPAMVFGAWHGILGLALAYIPIQIVELPAALGLAHRVLDVSPRQVWQAARTPIVATLAMTAGVLAAETALRGMGAGDLLTVGVCLPLAGIIYLGALLVIDRGILAEAHAVLVKGF